jgi:hypothetical protein
MPFGGTFFKDLPLKMDAHHYLDAYRAGHDEMLRAVKYPYRLDRSRSNEDEEEGCTSFVAGPAVVLPSSLEDEKQTGRRAQIEAFLAVLTPNNVKSSTCISGWVKNTRR